MGKARRGSPPPLACCPLQTVAGGANLVNGCSSYERPLDQWGTLSQRTSRIRSAGNRSHMPGRSVPLSGSGSGKTSGPPPGSGSGLGSGSWTGPTPGSGSGGTGKPGKGEGARTRAIHRIDGLWSVRVGGAGGSQKASCRRDIITFSLCRGATSGRAIWNLVCS